MRVLIIEDNAFIAYCLSRFLESVIGSVAVTVVNNSQDALSFMERSAAELVFLDGELSLIDECSTHGPKLADVLLQKYPHLPLIAWSDSESMRNAFTKVFMHHNRLVNEYNLWTKTVSHECIHKALAYYFDEFMIENSPLFSSVNEPRPSFHLYQ